MEDPTLLWASKNRSQLEKRALFVLPSEKSLEVASDKSLTLRLAEKIGAPMPRTFWPSHPDEIDHLLTTHFDQAEWVIKPVQGSGSKGILYGAGKPFSKTEFIEKIRTHWTEHGPLLLQERIPATGRGIGASFLMNRDGNVVAEFLHERIQQYPVSGGPSTDRVSIHHPEIKDWSLKLLRELSWQGIAMVEWKSDPRDGRFKLMEINPRFWGSLELAVRAGVDFPKLYAEVCLGHPLAAYPPAYPDGVRCRWMMPGEILRYLSTPKDQRESIPAFLKGLPARAEEWDTKDLRGALATIICTFCLALNPRYWKYLRRG
jgi:predicted ATP-grasp superfamily ATP-dependent carboligase